MMRINHAKVITPSPALAGSSGSLTPLPLSIQKDYRRVLRLEILEKSCRTDRRAFGFWKPIVLGDKTHAGAGAKIYQEGRPLAKGSIFFSFLNEIGRPEGVQKGSRSDSAVDRALQLQLHHYLSHVGVNATLSVTSVSLEVKERPHRHLR